MEETIAHDTQQAVHSILEGYLHERGLRLTPERLAIVDAIYDEEGHFTIEQLHDELVIRRFRVSLATLYNNMEMLFEAGLVFRHYFGPTTMYERRYGMAPHMHRICMICGDVQDLRNDRMTNILSGLRIRGFKTDTSYHYVYGTCNKCAAALRKKNKKQIKK